MLLDFAASAIFTDDIEDMFVAQGPREELLSHYLLHELQEIFRGYVKGVTYYKQKSMVTYNSCVKSDNWNAAARAIMNLKRKIEMLANADLNATGLVTLQCEKPSARVTQVKQVSYISYPAGAKNIFIIYANYHAFTILFNKGETQAKYYEGAGQQKPGQRTTPRR